MSQYSGQQQSQQDQHQQLQSHLLQNESAADQQQQQQQQSLNRPEGTNEQQTGPSAQNFPVGASQVVLILFSYMNVLR
jgi:hypothetical protein